MVERLVQSGHEVRVSDLYAMRWKATLDADDFPHIEAGAHFDPVTDSLRAFEAGTQRDEVAAVLESIGASMPASVSVTGNPTRGIPSR